MRQEHAGKISDVITMTVLISWVWSGGSDFS